MAHPVRMAPKGSPQRLILLASLAFFVGSTIISLGKLYSAGGANVADEPIAVVQEDLSLQQQAHGYELVLKREPNNTTALEGLASTRMALHQPQEAIAPLQKLVALYPDRKDYAAQLAAATSTLK